jgi:hypothetical protein
MPVCVWYLLLDVGLVYVGEARYVCDSGVEVEGWMVLVIVIGSIVIGDLARAVAFDLSLVILLMLCRRGICISPDTRCRGRHLTTTYRKCR